MEGQLGDSGAPSGEKTDCAWRAEVRCDAFSLWFQTQCLSMSVNLSALRQILAMSVLRPQPRNGARGNTEYFLKVSHGSGFFTVGRCHSLPPETSVPLWNSPSSSTWVNRIVWKLGGVFLRTLDLSKQITASYHQTCRDHGLLDSGRHGVK